MDDREPTPRAGPCLEDTGLIPVAEAVWYYRLLYNYEFDVYHLIVYNGNPRIGLRVRVGLECLIAEYLIVESCGEGSAEILKYSDEPEVVKVVIEKDCVRLFVPFDPPVRAKRMLEKLGITGLLRILDYYASKE